MPLLDHFERVVDQRERGQPEEIHLEKRELLETVHVVLGDDFIPVGAGERDDVSQRLGRDDDARGVHGRIAREAFEAQRHIEHFLNARVLFGEFFETRLRRDGVLQLDVEDVRHQLGDAVHVGEAHVEHAAHVFDRGARAQRIEGDDLGDLLAAIFLGDVLDHFAAAVHAEIDIDIGHADAFGIEEALEQQPVLQRIDIGDLHRVADQTSRRRTTSGADRNVFDLAKRMKSQTIRK